MLLDLVIDDDYFFELENAAKFVGLEKTNRLISRSLWIYMSLIDEWKKSAGLKLTQTQLEHVIFVNHDSTHVE